MNIGREQERISVPKRVPFRLPKRQPARRQDKAIPVRKGDIFAPKRAPIKVPVEAE